MNEYIDTKLEENINGRKAYLDLTIPEISMEISLS